MSIKKLIAASLIPMSLLTAAGCSAQQPTREVPVKLPTLPVDSTKETREFTKDEGVSFGVNSQGAIIPVSKSGKPFKVCGTLDDPKSCSLFKKGIAINKMEQVSITKIEHQINPTCLIYVVRFQGKDYIYFDPSDPNCAEFN